MNVLCKLGVHRWSMWGELYEKQYRYHCYRTGKTIEYETKLMRDRICRGCNIIQTKGKDNEKTRRG